MKNILIVGATSAIAEATARVLAARGCAVFLVGRDKDRLHAIAADLRIRGAVYVDYDVLDINDFSAHELMLNHAECSLGGIDTALIAHGTLSDQPACENSIDLMITELTTNGLSVAVLAMRIAAILAKNRGGTLVAISSVAGDRGRQSNYVYGSAKALVTSFMSGLRQRLHKHGVKVITVKPGFVDTPMTSNFKKGALWAQPSDVARGIVKAIDRNTDIVYLPWFWRPIMYAVRMIPERLFKSLTL